jgi:hypothetical protein
MAGKAGGSLKVRKCIFCGGTPLTKEHVWPKWLRPHIVRDQKNHHSLVTLAYEGHSEESRRMWGGDPRNRGVRTVCGSCNGGWMSRLQELAKPLVLPLVTGKTIELSTQDQRTLAFWCAMCVMTAEFLNQDRTAISPLDRTLLMKDQLLVHNWKIWLGHYERKEWVGQWVHNMMPISSKERVHPTDDGMPRANTQTTTLVFGRLYVHVFSCEYPDVVSKIELGERGNLVLAQIWPIIQTFIVWPREAMTDRDADNLAGAICAMLDQIGRDVDPERFTPSSPFPSVL